LLLLTSWFFPVAPFPQLRPGRIDRKIEFPLPDEKTKQRIFSIHTAKMTLGEDVNLEVGIGVLAILNLSCIVFSWLKALILLLFVTFSKSPADIKAICTEAGLMALRERRMRVVHADFRKARENVLYKKQDGAPPGLYL
jgi:26S proteasome regulatory subunit T2